MPVAKRRPLQSEGVRRRWSRRQDARREVTSRTVKAVVEPLERRRLLSATVSWEAGAWEGLGPGPIEDSRAVQGMGLQGSPVGGAVQAIAFSPVDPSIAVIGRVNGGIWRSLNAQSTPFDLAPPNSPSWSPMIDEFPSLSIGDIAFNPPGFDVSVVWAGTGPTSSALRLGGQGGLIYRSPDLGLTWSVYSALGAGPDASKTITTILPTAYSIDPANRLGTQVILAGTGAPDEEHPENWDGGLFRSQDRGLTWAELSGTSIPTGAITSIVADPNDSLDRIY